MRIDPTDYICMGTRYYDSLAGRFMSPDPLGHAASMDLYSYANGDPINFVDPTGRKPIGVPEREGDPTGKPPPETQNDVPFNPNLSWQNITDSVNNAMEEARSQAALAEQQARADAFFNTRESGFGTIGGVATDLQRNARRRDTGTGVSRNEDLSISFNVNGPPIAVVDGSYGSAYTQADLLQLYNSGVTPLGEDKGHLIPHILGVGMAVKTTVSLVNAGITRAFYLDSTLVITNSAPRGLYGLNQLGIASQFNAEATTLLLGRAAILAGNTKVQASMLGGAIFTGGSFTFGGIVGLKTPIDPSWTFSGNPVLFPLQGGLMFGSAIGEADKQHFNGFISGDSE